MRPRLRVWQIHIASPLAFAQKWVNVQEYTLIRVTLEWVEADCFNVIDITRVRSHERMIDGAI